MPEKLADMGKTAGLRSQPMAGGWDRGSWRGLAAAARRALSGPALPLRLPIPPVRNPPHLRLQPTTMSLPVLLRNRALVRTLGVRGFSAGESGGVRSGCRIGPTAAQNVATGTDLGWVVDLQAGRRLWG